MTARLVLASHNIGKVAELREILDGLDVTLVSAADVDLPEVEETGDSFAANALLKATAGVTAAALPCVADDSGLCVDALGGAPGIYSARFAASRGQTPANAADTDRVNVDLVLQLLQGIPAERRTARFVCAAALALPGGDHHLVEATVEGRLVAQPRGTGGFGYDPLFVPDGHTLTTAQMTPAQKHVLSHRGKAFRKLRPVIARCVTKGV